MPDVYDVVIIGGGPAGLAAAIYAIRANLSTLCVAGSKPGGALMLTTEVEDYPGFEQPIQGPELMERMRKQCERLKVEFMDENVDSVDFKAKPFTVKLDDKTLKAKTVVIATGGDFKMLGLPSESKYLGKGVSTCAVCDGFFFRGKDIVVIGGGDSAAREALFLANIVKTVTIVHRRGEMRAQPVLQQRLKASPKIKFEWNSEVQEIKGNTFVNSVVLKNNQTNALKELKVDGVFVAIGHEPGTKLFKDKIEIDQKGYIVLKKGQQTSVPGVFAAGDVHDYTYQQAVTAAGYGAAAALEAYRYLEAQKLDKPNKKK